MFSCDRSNIYKIEGQLSGLDNTTLYFVYESSYENHIDTIICDEEGQFSTFREHIEDLQVINIYYNDRKHWFSVFPETGSPVKVKGEADYPLMIDVKGGRTNNKLSEFKKKAAPLLKEMADISDDSRVSILSKGESIMQLANTNIELRRTIQDFINKYPKEEASAILIYSYYTDPEIMLQAEELLNILTPELDEFFVVKKLKTLISKARTTMVGAEAPDFRVVNTYGQTLTPDHFANKYYILAFTALWCDMCQTETIMLDQMAAKYSKDSLEILFVSLDDEFDKVRDIIQKDSSKWNLVTDSAGQAIKLFETYNVNSLPSCFLIDKDGKIKLRTNNSIELQQVVEEVMK